MSKKKRFRIGLQEQFDLTIKEAMFIIEYVKDGGTRRSAEVAGFSPETAYRYLNQENVKGAIEQLMLYRMEDAVVDSDWHLDKLVDGYYIAMQSGKLSAANQSLAMIGKHKRVDAFAADKIKVSTDADVVDRLVAARKRTRNDDEVSFM